MPSNEAQLLMDRLQEREREFLQAQQFSMQLAPVVTESHLGQILVKVSEELSFDGCCIAKITSDELEIFASSELAMPARARFNLDDGLRGPISSPDISVVAITSGTRTSGLFSKINLRSKSVVVMPLRVEAGEYSALFFARDPRGPERSIMRMLRFLSTQLSITTANVLAFQSPKAPELPDAFEQIPTVGDPVRLLGSGEAITDVKNLIAIVAPADTGVLVQGESGTGKEVVAALIHSKSSRKNGNYVRVNCAAIPSNLLESELFGHEKGSFTGAVHRKKGKFELAHKGTLFLDEIGEIPFELQGKLLRALQEGEVARIGAPMPMKVNVRIIAATNRDLALEVKAGRSRADLFYRLNIFPIRLPALRDRSEDLPELANFFLAKSCADANRKPMSFSAETLRSLPLYSWPGNVRELQNLVSRAVLLTEGNVVLKLDYPTLGAIETVPDLHVKTLAENERAYILEVLAKCGNRISGPNGAAKLLGLPSTTLISRMQKLGIKKRLIEGK